MINDDGWVLAGKFLGFPPSLKTKRFMPLIIYYIIQLYNIIIFAKSTDKKIKITCRPGVGVTRLSAVEKLFSRLIVGHIKIERRFFLIR